MKKLAEPLGVGCGCMLGALVRYTCVSFLASFLLAEIIILVVNLSGCFLFGIFKAAFSTNKVRQKFLTTGFCGGLTTFSTLMLGSTTLFLQQRIFLGGAYLVLMLLLGICAVYFGKKLGQIKRS